LSELIETEPVNARRRSGMKRTNKAILIAGSVLLVIAAIAYYQHSRSFESTDNAFIEGGVIQVSPRVSGQVVQIYVADNQRIQKGDLLLEIDSRDYELRVAETKARMADAEARFSSAQSGVVLTSDVINASLSQATAALNAAVNQTEILSARLQQQESEIQAAEASLRQAEAGRVAAEAGAQRARADVIRYRSLYKKDELSRQMLDRGEADATASDAAMEAAVQAVSSARARLEQSKSARTSTVSGLRQSENLAKQASGKLQEARAGSSQVRIRESEVKSAKAQIAQFSSLSQEAELNLSFTRIYASESGIITRKSVEPGNFVQVGQSLMAIVTDRLWVVANFKETQLTHMKPGQPVDIRIDAYPKNKLKGRVDSIQTGTGARFSLLPAENATGNYVKVIQRMPVKITFIDPPPAGIRLGPGMSVEPTVRIR
jgi:membrane fusion protein, multidrug efflux system